MERPLFHITTEKDVHWTYCGRRSGHHYIADPVARLEKKGAPGHARLVDGEPIVFCKLCEQAYKKAEGE